MNIVLFWFHDDWGKYGRAYERVAKHLVNLAEVGEVVVIFPPNPSQAIWSRSPLHIREITDSLKLLSVGDSSRSGRSDFSSRIISKTACFWGNRALNSYLKQLGFDAKNTILWLFPPHPYLEQLVYSVPHKGVVTHVIDDFTKFDPSHELYSYAHDQYPKLGNWSDMFITTSQANHERFSKYGKPCYMFWPAVDESFFGEPSTPPPPDSSVPPRLGYVGFIMERTDLEVLSHLAANRPDWHVILAGPQYPENYLIDSGLLDCSNVEYIGAIPQEEVPNFIQSLDVCLMPHRDNEYSKSMGPLKLYQYLASGKPIVSTNISGLDHVREYISVANDEIEFEQLIDRALKSDSILDSSKRIAMARDNTWPLRVREIYDVVNIQMESK